MLSLGYRFRSERERRNRKSSSVTRRQLLLAAGRLAMAPGHPGMLELAETTPMMPRDSSLPENEIRKATREGERSSGRRTSTHRRSKCKTSVAKSDSAPTTKELSTHSTSNHVNNNVDVNQNDAYTDAKRQARKLKNLPKSTSLCNAAPEDHSHSSNSDTAPGRKTGPQDQKMDPNNPGKVGRSKSSRSSGLKQQSRARGNSILEIQTPDGIPVSCVNGKSQKTYRQPPDNRNDNVGPRLSDPKGDGGKKADPETPTTKANKSKQFRRSRSEAMDLGSRRRPLPSTKKLPSSQTQDNMHDKNVLESNSTTEHVGAVSKLRKQLSLLPGFRFTSCMRRSDP